MLVALGLLYLGWNQMHKLMLYARSLSWQSPATNDQRRNEARSFKLLIETANLNSWSTVLKNIPKLKRKRENKFS